MKRMNYVENVNNAIDFFLSILTSENKEEYIETYKGDLEQFYIAMLLNIIIINKDTKLANIREDVINDLFNGVYKDKDKLFASSLIEYKNDPLNIIRITPYYMENKINLLNLIRNSIAHGNYEMNEHGFIINKVDVEVEVPFSFIVNLALGLLAGTFSLNKLSMCILNPNTNYLEELYTTEEKLKEILDNYELGEIKSNKESNTDRLRVLIEKVYLKMNLITQTNKDKDFETNIKKLVETMNANNSELELNIRKLSEEEKKQIMNIFTTNQYAEIHSQIQLLMDVIIQNKNLFSMMFNEVAITGIRNNQQLKRKKYFFKGNVENSLTKNFEFKEVMIVQSLLITKIYTLLTYNKEVIYDNLFAEYSSLDISKFNYTYPNIVNKLKKMETDINEEAASLLRKESNLNKSIENAENSIKNHSKTKEEKPELVARMDDLIRTQKLKIEEFEKEKLENQKAIIQNAKKSIELETIRNSSNPSAQISKFDFVTHLRNSVAHGHHKFVVNNSGDILDQTVVFEDFYPETGNKTFHAEISVLDLLKFLDNEIYNKLFIEAKSFHI